MRAVVSALRRGRVYLRADAQIPGAILRSVHQVIDFLQVGGTALQLVLDHAAPPGIWASVAHEEIVSRANGSTFLEISKTNFKPIPVVLPSKPVLDAFVVAVNPMYRVIVSNLREIQSLVKLRDSLLPKLMFGEMRFKDAEQLIGDAV